ncbi:hypothetical protein Pelo_15044 [Pelomyxa schiedti]|nr:hypothetical protein Pelo_15044 [Pelomyxa schiedti]
MNWGSNYVEKRTLVEFLSTRRGRLFEEGGVRVAEGRSTLNGAKYIFQLLNTDTTHDYEGYRLRYLPYKMSSIFVFCFSLDIPDSLSQILNHFYPEARMVLPREGTPMILVGLKSDILITGIREDRKGSPKFKLISQKEACSKMGLHAAIQVSSATGHGTQQLLNLVCDILEEQKSSQPVTHSKDTSGGIWTRMFGKKSRTPPPTGTASHVSFPGGSARTGGEGRELGSPGAAMNVRQIFGGLCGTPEFTSYGHSCILKNDTLTFFGGVGPDKLLRKSPFHTLDLITAQWIPNESDTKSCSPPLANELEKSPAPSTSTPNPRHINHTSSCDPGSKSIFVGSFPATCTSDDKSVAFLFGGSSSSVHTNRLVAFNMAEKSWRTLSEHTDDATDNYPLACYGASLLHLHGRLYLFGGCSTEGPSSQFLVFSLETCEWGNLGTTASNVPPPRFHHNAFTDGRVVYVYGGLGQGNSKLGDLWSIEPTDSLMPPSKLSTTTASTCLELIQCQWRKISTSGTQPTPQRGHVGCFWEAENCFLLVGSSNQNPHCEISRLDMRTFTWVQISLSVPIVAREFHTVISTAKSVIVACGVQRSEQGGILGDGYILLRMIAPSSALPVTVWLTIFSLLAMEDLLSISHVCRDFRTICETDDLWRKFLPECGPTITDLRQKITGTRLLWINPTPTVLKYKPPIFQLPSTRCECFLGDANVLMADLTTKKVSEIRIRDSVMTELLKPRSVKEIRTQKIERPFRFLQFHI